MASPTAICAAVAAGVGPGVVSDLAAGPGIEQHRLRRVDVTGLDLHRQLRAVWHPPRRPRCLQWLLGS
jgi:DNA-binding transcriptional LysR family regulator